MVAFSRITFVLAVAGLSSAQSFSGPAPSGAFPSGAARPTGGFGGHGHGGDHSGFPHPTGGFHSGGPRPSGTGVFAAQRAQQSDEVPYPSAGDFSAFPSAFPSGAARPTGGFGGHGHGGHGGHGTAPTVAPSSALERRQQPSGTPPAFSGSFPAPSGGFPSGGFPESGAPFPTGAFSGFPSGVAHPSAHHGHHGHGGKPSGKPSGPAPTGFVTSTVRGA
ncbi:hypothetical protein SLS59_008706 [Nothophoma quercina]|uniref:Uncharacterized protein n=1 Tax=Nothophoma quercina TaxID=749835 RepID=A0ABR3QR75_9PLEO